MILEVVVILLVLLWIGTLGAFVVHVRNQQKIAAQQAEGDALRDQRIKELARRVDNFQNGTVRMGEDLHELRSSAILRPCPSPRPPDWSAWEPASTS